MAPRDIGEGVERAGAGQAADAGQRVQAGHEEIMALLE